MTRIIPARTSPPRTATLLAASAIGVYLLVMVGAATSLLDGHVACPTWPACGGEWLVSPGDSPALIAAWGHRVLTLLVGGLLVVTTLLAYRRGAGRRVLAPLAAVAALYPVQMALGALTTLGGAPTGLSAVHLVVAMGIFSGVLLALLAQLEADVPADATPRTAVDSDELRPEPGDDLPDAPPPAAGSDDGPLATVSAYVELTKPKLWWLLCLVALASMGLAAGPALRLGTAVATVVGGILAIGASGTFNNVAERDVDRRMARTNERPLVEGRVPVRNALAFGGLLTVASVFVFVTFVNVLSAALGVLAILFYSVGYTLLLKPHTTQNSVIGGGVGAFPALIGWAAVTDSIGMPAVVLGAVIFLWTPAHFYNLAMVYKADYARAGFPMLPVVRGDAVTRRHVLLYLGATMLGAVVLGTTTTLDWPFAAVATLLGGVFLWAVVRLYRERTKRAAFRAFHASNAYLGTLLVVVVVDALVA